MLRHCCMYTSFWNCEGSDVKAANLSQLMLCPPQGRGGRTPARSWTHRWRSLGQPADTLGCHCCRCRERGCAPGRSAALRWCETGCEAVQQRAVTQHVDWLSKWWLLTGRMQMVALEDCMLSLALLWWVHAYTA